MNKLELNWIDKYNPENKINPEPRILIEKSEYSYAAEPIGQMILSANKATSDNMLIRGDNLLALKSLQDEYTGRISAVIIDPPYNTQSCFEHYDDNLEHSMWLNLMKPRLELLKMLLTVNGSIWISIDDDECHYLKVLCDEVFGRRNFITSITWEKKYTVANDAKLFSDNHDYILVYAKDISNCKLNKLPRTEEMNKAYKNPDNHPKGVWKATPLHAKSGSTKGKDFTYTFKNGVVWSPPAGRFPRYSAESLEKFDLADEIWFGKDGNLTPSKKTFLSELNSNGIPPRTVWRFDEVGHNHEAKEEAKTFNSESAFATPKPERLLHRIIHLATNPGDLVLDSFLGSGTTAAVAHKMGRRWIGIELGDHAYTHCYPRLKAVVDGEQGGISKAVNWQGGGGFKFYELAPTLLEKSEYGHLVISDKYNNEMLARAMAKHEGYTYAPDESSFWKQGYSGDNNFIYTTTGYISAEYLDNIASQLGDGEYLLICAKSFDTACLNRHENVIVRPIPRMLLGRCEWGKDNYDLNIILQDSESWGEDDDE